MASLYRQHSAALASAYADVENHALSQGETLVGTPGAISIRTNTAGARFHVRQYYDHDGRKRDQYLAAAPGDPAVDATIEEWGRRIAEANDILRSVRLLAREGYSTLAPKHFAAIATLSNHGIFKAGAVLVGTHAFEVIANRMGIRAAAFATEDVDIARPAKLALEKAPKGGLLELLRESGIDFVDVPGMGHADPPTRFKEKGRSRFTFDLLVPASGNEIQIESVPELKAHATALPYLRYLIAQTQDGAVMSKHGVAAVRVPLPERFALHKLIVAQLRTGRPQKSIKDQQQAAALIAALGELHPGALLEAYEGTPTSVRKHIRTGLRQIQPALTGHQRGWQEIADVAKP